MTDDDKNFGGSLVLDFKKLWRHMHTLYRRKMNCSIVPRGEEFSHSLEKHIVSLTFLEYFAFESQISLAHATTTF